MPLQLLVNTNLDNRIISLQSFSAKVLKIIVVDIKQMLKVSSGLGNLSADGMPLSILEDVGKHVLQTDRATTGDTKIAAQGENKDRYDGNHAPPSQPQTA